MQTLDITAQQPKATWSGMTEANHSCASGVYFYRCKTPQGVTTGKVVKLN